jgi:hypothetical protein
MSRAVLYVLLETLFRYFMRRLGNEDIFICIFKCLPAISFSLKILAAAASPSHRRLIPPNYLLYERASKITMATQSLFWHRDFPLFLSFFEMVLLLLLLTYLSNLPRAILISSQRQDISLIWSAVRFDSHFSKTVLQVSEAL